MTDQGRFELLVTSVLRKHKPEYAAILHLGTNADGKTVRSPLDGFCLIPNSDPPHFLLIQHTTDKRLEAKWLHDHATVRAKKSSQMRKTMPPSESDDGDLIKAGRETQKYRQDYPNAVFTVILATNHSIQKDIADKVYGKATQLGVSVDFWESSRIADFLDTTPEGHYMRKMYLGIDAEMLSQSLLSDLCRRNLHLYGDAQHFMTSPDRWISRRFAQPPIRKACTLQLLVGEPGFGKSVLAYQLLQEHLEAGGYGLWMQAQYLENSLSIESALDKVLQELSPRLQPDSAQGLLQLIPENSRFLIVVDDIHQTSDPTRAVSKLVQWSHFWQPGGSRPGEQSPPYLFICPIWPHVWESARSRFGQTPWVHTLDVGSMLLGEACEAIQKASNAAVTTITAYELAIRLHGDPFLLGVAGSRLSEAGQPELDVLAREVIDRYITDRIEETYSASEVSACLVPNDYRGALSKLVFQTLRERNLQPSWTTIRCWFESDPIILQALRELSRHKKLCRLERGDDVFSFRHDRIRDAIAVDVITHCLGNSLGNNDILLEPHYAEMIGQALAHSPHRDDGLLEEMGEKLPLALAEAIRSFGEPTSEFHQAIIGEIRKWMSRHGRGGPESIRNAVLWRLARTDSSTVLDLTENYHDDDYPFVCLAARFRNGSVESGVRYCSLFGLSPIGSPSPYGSLWYQIVEHAKQRHRDKVLQKLRPLCASPSSDQTRERGDIVLAGFLGLPDLAEHIIAGWKMQDDKRRFLPETVLASIRCYEPENEELLDPLIAYWAQLSDVAESERERERDAVASSSYALLSFGVSNAAIDYLIAQSRMHAELRPHIAHMLSSYIDKPNVVEFVTRVAAEIEQASADKAHSALWFDSLVHGWTVAHSSGHGLSADSSNRLKALWDNRQEDATVRQRAFDLWLTRAEPADLDTLAGIPFDSPLSHAALWVRLQFGDRSAARDALPLLPAETNWFRVAHLAWCTEFIGAAQRCLADFKSDIPQDFSGGRLDQHYNLSELLMKIPKEDAETLIACNWEHLRYSPLFVQAALYVGTPKCMMLAANGISHSPGSIDVFDQYFTRQWMLGLEVTLKSLDSLKPYLDRFNDHELAGCAEACERLGEAGIEWRKKNLLHLLEKHGMRQRFHPTLDDLMERLEQFKEYGGTHYWAGEWLKCFATLGDSREPLEVLERWLASKPTYHRFRFVAECIGLIGDRTDLPILDKYPVEHERLFHIDWIKESTSFIVRRRTLK